AQACELVQGRQARLVGEGVEVQLERLAQPLLIRAAAEVAEQRLDLAEQLGVGGPTRQRAEQHLGGGVELAEVEAQPRRLAQPAERFAAGGRRRRRVDERLRQAAQRAGALVVAG